MGLSYLSKAERLALERFSREARGFCGAALREMRVFGSRVRGEGHPESDLDVFVLLSAKTKVLERALDDLAADLLTETGVMLDPRVWGEEEWCTWLRHERALALAIQVEGVPV